MESLLPSEIARLVYGYLEEEECNTAANAFLEKSPHLKECLAVANKGRKFNTKIYGFTLVDLLDLLSEAVNFVKEHSKELKEENRNEYRLLSLFLLDGSSSSGFLESSKEYDGRNDESPIKKVQNHGTFESRHTKKVSHLVSHMEVNDTFQKLEGSSGRHNAIIPSQKAVDISTNIQIKEENGEDGNYPMEDCGQNDIIPNIEPEVQISSSPTSDLLNGMSRQEAPTVNVITNPIMVSGRPSQLVCQPYNMVQMLPTAYPGAINPNISTVYFPHAAIPQHPVMSVQQQSSAQPVQPVSTLYQTTVRTSTNNAVQNVWPKPSANGQQQQNSSSKLRPIAPKITQSLDNGVKVQVVHTKENPLVETNPTICKKNLRSRKKSPRTYPSKSRSTPYFGDKK